MVVTEVGGGSRCPIRARPTILGIDQALHREVARLTRNIGRFTTVLYEERREEVTIEGDVKCIVEKIETRGPERDL